MAVAASSGRSASDLLLISQKPIKVRLARCADSHVVDLLEVSGYLSRVAGIRLMLPENMRLEIVFPRPELALLLVAELGADCTDMAFLLPDDRW